MSDPIGRAAAGIEAATGMVASSAQQVPGGDVCRAARLHLADGTTVFVKHRDGAPAGMFAAEAAGLRWLAEPAGLRVPGVVAVGDDWLALEWIPSGAPGPKHDEALGRGLARIHRSGAQGFGAPWPGLIGPLPVPNDQRDDWPTFLGECRLLPLAQAAGLDAPAMRDLERVVRRLPDLIGPPEPPARLHGDLWSGNRMTHEEGAPVLVDPAAFGGHREVDLAMMRLFGGFPERVFAAYDEENPLAPGWRERVELNQLIPLLVHAALFGGGYPDRVREIVTRLR